MYITIDGIVSFAPNIGVLVHEEAVDVDPVRVHDAIRLAWSHMADEMLCDAIGGSNNALAKHLNREITYKEYVELVARLEHEQKLRKATTASKRHHTRLRRVDYSARRSQLILKLIESGVTYVCAHPECNECDELTLDHIVPISKGGTDELENLQFLCLRHNSQKGDRETIGESK